MEDARAPILATPADPWLEPGPGVAWVDRGSVRPSPISREGQVRLQAPHYTDSMNLTKAA